jgi:hypothetical protein
MLDVLNLLVLLWNGLCMLGQAIWGLVNLPLNLFHIVVPEWIIQIVTLAFFIVFLFKYGKKMTKIILVVLLIVFGIMLFSAILG